MSETKAEEMGRIIAPFLHKKVGIRLKTDYMIWGEITDIHTDGIRILDKSQQMHYVAYSMIIEVSDTYDETKGVKNE